MENIFIISNHYYHGNLYKYQKSLENAKITLSFEHHIKSLYSQLNRTLSYLNKVKNPLDKKSRILLINALIFSHLNCSS